MNIAKQEVTFNDYYYLAGLFDGEGSAGVYRLSSRPWPYPVVQVTMTDRKPVSEFKRVFGGYLSKGNRRTVTHKRAYAWMASYRNAERLALGLYPFIRNPAKQKQLGKILRHYGDI